MLVLSKGKGKDHGLGLRGLGFGVSGLGLGFRGLGFKVFRV